MLAQVAVVVEHFADNLAIGDDHARAIGMQQDGAEQLDGRDLAVVYAGFDDKDKTFAWLEKAFADHSVMLAFLKLEPLLEPLQSDPRWKDLERRVGISN